MYLSYRKNSALLRKILTDTDVRKGIVEFGYEEAEYREPEGIDTVFFSDEEEGDCGAALYRFITSKVVELHTCLLVKAYGRSGVAFDLFKSFLIDNTPANQIITWIPNNNPLAKRAALRAGFTKAQELDDGFSSQEGNVSLTLYRYKLRCQQ